MKVFVTTYQNRTCIDPSIVVYQTRHLAEQARITVAEEGWKYREECRDGNIARGYTDEGHEWLRDKPADRSLMADRYFEAVEEEFFIEEHELICEAEVAA